ncbi:MAG: stage II sporulation protein M [Armatimonadetes bacterium]|nr:stage II sporulation protein M [Armatimonadota bacterium]
MTTDARGAKVTASGEAAASPFLWDVPSVVRCARAFVGATVVIFVLGVAVGALLPGLPSRLLGALETINLWPAAYLSHLAPIFVFILLSNTKSALIAALLGPLGAWVNARANVGYPSAREGEGRPAGPLDRLTLALARAILRAGGRVVPGLADPRQDLAARTGAALAAVVPFLALGMNALVLGLWMAEALLEGWVTGLARMGLLLLPHAPVELPALVLAAAVGLRLAERLTPRQPGHDAAWQRAEARRQVTADRVAQSLGLIVGLLAIAAALELYRLA